MLTCCCIKLFRIAVAYVFRISVRKSRMMSWFGRLDVRMDDACFDLDKLTCTLIANYCGLYAHASYYYYEVHSKLSAYLY